MDLVFGANSELRGIAEVDQTEVGNGCPQAFDESTPPEFWPGPLDCAALIEKMSARIAPSQTFPNQS